MNLVYSPFLIKDYTNKIGHSTLCPYYKTGQMNTYDAIIIGGGILGCASAYELAKRGQKVLLFEKEYLGSGSTGRCIGGIRQQFSTRGSIELAMMSVNIFSSMEEEFGESVEWYPGGYLFLATSAQEKAKYLELIKIQRAVGLEVDFIERDAVLSIVPLLEDFSFVGASYCKTDGQANPFSVLKNYAQEIKKLKGEIRSYTKVVKINTRDGRVDSVITEDGKKFSSSIVINAGGPWAKMIHQFVDIKLPVLPIEPERHEALITEPTQKLFDPMLVSYSPSCYFQQMQDTGQIIGCYTPSDPLKGVDCGSSFEFLSECSARMLKIIPQLAELKVIRSWGGSYEITPDGNPIVGETEIKGLWVIGGTSGHGFMFGPALGKLLVELTLDGEITATAPRHGGGYGGTSISIAEFSINRKFKSEEALK